MKLEHHERFIKDSLQGHMPPVDTDALWDAIQPELHPKKKKRRFIIWWFTGLGAALLLLGVLLFQQSPSSITTNNSELEHNTTSTISSPHTTTGASTQLHTTATNTTNKKSEAETHDHQSSNIPHSNTANRINNVNNNIDDAGSAQNNFNKKLTTKPNSQADRTHEQSQSESILMQQPTINDPSKSTTPMTMSQIENQASDNESPSVETPIALNEKNKKKHAPGLHISDIPTNEKEAVAVCDALNTLVLFPLPIEEEETPPVVNLSLKKAHKWQLGISAGWGMYSQSLSAQNEEYDAFYNRVTSPVSSQHVDLNLSYAIKPQWQLTTGIHYSRFVQRTELHEVFVIDTVVGGVTEQYFTLSGDSQTTTGQLPAQRRVTNNIRWHSYQERLDVPITIGRTFNRNRWGVTPQVGFQYQLWTKNNGAYIDQQHKLINYANEENIVRTQQRHRFLPMARLSAEYQLSMRQRLFINSTFIGRINQQLLFDEPIQEKRNAIYFSMGTSYTF